MDDIGETYVDWMTTTETLPVLVNVTHPQPITWELVLQYVREALAMDLKSVPLREWVQRLENSAATASLDGMARLVRSVMIHSKLPDQRLL